MEKEITTLDELWQALLKGDISPADAAKMLDVGGRFKRTIDLFLNRDSVYPPYQYDDNDMLENQLEKFVQTDFIVGITKKDYNKIRKILDV